MSSDAAVKHEVLVETPGANTESVLAGASSMGKYSSSNANVKQENSQQKDSPRKIGRENKEDVTQESDGDHTPHEKVKSTMGDCFAFFTNSMIAKTKSQKEGEAYENPQKASEKVEYS